jgi:hypothetical protein
MKSNSEKNKKPRSYQDGGPVGAANGPGAPSTGTTPLPRVGARPRFARSPLADYLSGAGYGFRDGGEVGAPAKRRGQGGASRPARPGQCGT